MRLPPTSSSSSFAARRFHISSRAKSERFGSRLSGDDIDVLLILYWNGNRDPWEGVPWGLHWEVWVAHNRPDSWAGTRLLACGWNRSLRRFGSLKRGRVKEVMESRVIQGDNGTLRSWIGWLCIENFLNNTVFIKVQYKDSFESSVRCRELNLEMSHFCFDDVNHLAHRELMRYAKIIS